MAAGLMRFMVALQLLLLALFATASPIDSSLAATEGNVTQCTRNCWVKSIEECGCDNKDPDAETKCMCTSYDNYESFYHSLFICMYEGDFHDLTPAMECVGYKNRARDVDELVERAASPQIAALTPWRTDPPKPKAPEPVIYSTYHHVSFPATWGFCGVPGESCNGKIIETEPSTTAEPTKIAERKDASYFNEGTFRDGTYYPPPATWGFCGVPGENCNGKLVETEPTTTVKPTKIVKRKNTSYFNEGTMIGGTYYPPKATWGYCGVPGESCNFKMVDEDADAVISGTDAEETGAVKVADDKRAKVDGLIMPGSGVAQRNAAPQATTFKKVAKIIDTVPAETGVVQKRKATSMTHCSESSSTNSDEFTSVAVHTTISPDICEISDICAGTGPQ